MATRKFVYSDADGDLVESSGAYEAADHVSTSAGGADAGKPIVLDGSGKIDATMIDDTDIDHGAISGLGDDDHTQYTLADGTRAFSGDQSMGGNKLTALADGVASTDAVNLGQLNAAVSGLQDFRESVIDKDILTPPGSPTAGDRYIIGQPSDTATGAWAGEEGKIAQYNGASWEFEVVPNEGTYCYVEDENSAYVFNNDVFASGSWALFNSTNITAGDGIELAGQTISVDLKASSGLKIDATELAVEPADFAGLGLEAVLDNLAIDFADPATEMGTSRAVKASDLNGNLANQGAKIIGADPASISFSTATTVQGILEDIASNVTALPTYTVATGGVSAGDLCIVSADNETKPKSNLSTNEYGIGLAFTTEAASGTVQIVADNVIIAGVLTSLSVSAGDRIFWDGSNLTDTIPSGSGAYVWFCGVAKNADDLDVHVEYLKRNV